MERGAIHEPARVEGAPFPLTLTLSLGEREHPRQLWEESQVPLLSSPPAGSQPQRRNRRSRANGMPAGGRMVSLSPSWSLPTTCCAGRRGHRASGGPAVLVCATSSGLHLRFLRSAPRWPRARPAHRPGSLNTSAPRPRPGGRGKVIASGLATNRTPFNCCLPPIPPPLDSPT